MDIRNIIFPMTAGDLVESAVILGQQKRGDGGELKLYEVMHIEDIDHVHGDQGTLKISVREQVTYDRGEVVLKKDTPLLVTNIRRS